MTVCKMRLKFESNDSRHPEQYTVYVCYMFTSKTSSMSTNKSHDFGKGFHLVGPLPYLRGTNVNFFSICIIIAHSMIRSIIER
jgi:hypothetical protein